jgi:hypothetical protein
MCIIEEGCGPTRATWRCCTWQVSASRVISSFVFDAHFVPFNRDVNQYASTIRMFHIASANTLFDQLRNIVASMLHHHILLL